MPEWIIYVGGIFVFVLMLAISIGLHEAGHMTVAKIFKLRVPQFFVGFGPRIWSFKRKGTEYGLRAIPLGGFVAIEDETQPEKSFSRNSLSYVAPWKRQLIFAAGPAVNLVLGSVILLVTLVATPYLGASTTVDSLNPCVDSSIACGARASGVEVGDSIVAVGGETVESFEELTAILGRSEAVDLTVLRGGEELQLSDVAVSDGLIGVTVALEERNRNLPEAVGYIGSVMVANVDAVTKIPEKVPGIAESIVTGERDPEAPSSVVGVGKRYGDVAVAPNPIAEKLSTFAMYSGLFNLGLGILNLLPLMPLDGGRMFVAFLDSVKRAASKVRKRTYKPTGQKLMVGMTAITGATVLSFMVLIILSDFSLLFRGNL